MNNKALNAKEKKQNRQINKYIDILITKSKNFEAEGDNDVNEFKKIIKLTLSNQNQD